MTGTATRRGISRYANKVADIKLQFDSDNALGSKNESAKSGVKLIGKNSLHMKRRTDNADWPAPPKTSAGNISQIYSSSESQQLAFMRNQSNAVWNQIKG
jgi:hypothetical protein